MRRRSPKPPPPALPSPGSRLAASIRAARAADGFALHGLERLQSAHQLFALTLIRLPSRSNHPPTIRCLLLLPSPLLHLLLLLLLLRLLLSLLAIGKSPAASRSTEKDCTPSLG